MLRSMTHLPLYRDYLEHVGDPGAAATLVLADAISQPDLLSIKQTAAMLCLGTRTVNRMIARRELPVVHIGRSVRVRRSDLLSYLDSRA